MADSFYTAWAEVVPDFSKFGREVDKGFRNSMRPAGVQGGKDAGNGVKSGVLGSIGKLAAPIAAAFAGLQIGRMLADSITQASDLQEAGTAIAQVFGDQASAIQDFAKQGATVFGETEIAVLRAAQTFGVYGKAAGLAGGDLTSFTQDLVGLGTDLASFYNTDTQTAIDALGAGLRGESEPLRQFGVLLDDATLKARAMELGIYSGTGTLTQQQRVLAAQAEILAQTSDAQGDFERTSGGLANQQRILAAGWANLTTEIGTLFLPIATELVGFLNTSVIPALQGTVGWLTGGGLGGAFQTAMGFIQPVIDVLSAAFVPVFQELAPLFASVVPQLISLWTNLSPLGLILQAITPVLPQLTDAFSQLAGVLAGVLGDVLSALIPIFNHVASVLSGVLGEAIQSLMPVLMTIIPIVAQVAQTLGGVLGKVLEALSPVIHTLIGFIAQIVPVIMPIITAVLSLLDPLLMLLDPLIALIGEILPPLIDLFMGVLGPVLDLAGAIIETLVPIIQGLVTILQGVIEFVTGVFSGNWDQAWQGIQKIFDGFVETIGAVIDGTLKLLFEGIPNFIGDIFSNVGTWLVDAGANLIQGFIDGIMGMINAVGDAIGGVMDFVGGFFPNSPAKRGPFSGSGWSNLKKSGDATWQQWLSGFGDEAPDFPAPVVRGPSIPRPEPLTSDGFGGAAAGTKVDVRADFTNMDPEPAVRLLSGELAFALGG